MKNLLAILVLTWSNFAVADAINPVVEFSFPHDVAMSAYQNKQSCNTADGRWSDGVCFFNGSDTVEIKAQGSDYRIDIFTVRTNGTHCQIEGAGIAVDNNQIKIARQSDEDRMTVICEVIVKFSDKDTVSVSNNGKCTSYCGAEGILEIKAAKRVQ